MDACRRGGLTQRDLLARSDALNKNTIRDKPPSKYIPNFIDNPELEKTLATHLIDSDADGILSDDYDTFLTNRCKRIASELRRLFAAEG